MLTIESKKAGLGMVANEEDELQVSGRRETWHIHNAELTIHIRC